MDDIRIAEKARELLGVPVTSARRIENVPNNTVYLLETERARFIGKIYRSRDWPEEDKLAYVDRLLTEYGVPHAKMLAFDRGDPRFPNGFLLEEFVPGRMANDIPFTDAEGEAFYAAFGRLAARVHAIPMRGYGYFGGGDGCYDAFTDFIDDIMTENAEKAAALGLPEIHMLWGIRERVVERLERCGGLPPVLCHGDLSEKNVACEGEGLTLIDWDDALALPWVYDAARMTYQMKARYDADTLRRYTDAFLAAHGGDRVLFDAAEAPLHAYFKLDFAIYDASRSAAGGR